MEAMQLGQAGIGRMTTLQPQQLPLGHLGKKQGVPSDWLSTFSASEDVQVSLNK